MASLAQYTISKTVELMKSSRSFCKDGNLRLPKVVSNITVLESLPDSERSIKNIELFNESFQTTNLGNWLVNKEDSPEFGNSSFKPKLVPRTGILSVVAQLHDPLGLLAPFTLLEKNALQKVTHWKFLSLECAGSDPGVYI